MLQGKTPRFSSPSFRFWYGAKWKTWSGKTLEKYSPSFPRAHSFRPHRRFRLLSLQESTYVEILGLKRAPRLSVYNRQAASVSTSNIVTSFCRRYLQRRRHGRQSRGLGGCSPPVFAKFLQNLSLLPQILAFLCLQPPHIPVSPRTFKFTPPSRKGSQF